MIVQGFGNVGSNAARLMAQGRLQGDRHRRIGRRALQQEWNRYRGAAGNIAQRNGAIQGFPEAERADDAELLTSECEILIPAATENVITSHNAGKLKCRILAEGANGPTTAAADEILADKGVFVIPDILCNAGGVTTSYFEWVQDRQGYFWKESAVNDRLAEIMQERV